jgi:hypothetical protein
MPISHIHQALAQVRELRHRLIEQQRFRGYSGRARASGGLIALAGATLMSSPRFPDRDLARIAGWGTVFTLAVLVNYGALLYWFCHDPQVGRDWRRLRPALVVLPPLLAGGLLTFGLILRGTLDPLYGMWMTLYGLANLASHQVLPRAILLVGAFYLAAGGVCLLWPAVVFADPRAMGWVFFLGEAAGGAILHWDQTRRV